MGAISAATAESGRAFGAVFRNPGLRRINLAFAASVVGDWAYAIAVSVWAFQEGGATALGLFGVSRYVVMAVSGPVLSTLADRYPKKLVMIGADLARAVVVVAAAAVIATDGPNILVYGLALVTSAISLAFRPAQASLLPRLATDPLELTAANVVASTIESVGFFAGPALAGLLLAIADVEVVYLVNAATFLVSAALIAGLTVPATLASAAADEPEEEEAPASLLRSSLAGFDAIAISPELRLIAGLMAAQTVVAGASLVFGVSIALDLLDLGESGVGVLNSVLGVGGIIGGFVALLLARRGRIAGDFGYGVLLWAAPLLLIVVAPTLAATAAAFFTIGLANSLVDVNAYTIIQRVTPTEVMGRVFGALESLLTGGMAIGALLMPVLINTVGLRAGLAVIGGAITVLAIAGLPVLRRLDTTVLAPPGLALLRGVPMLAILPPPVIERLAHVLVPLEVPPNGVVFGEGDPGDRFWVIEGGEARVSIGERSVRTLGPGDSFGEIALLRDVPRTATVTAGESGLALRGLERDDFLAAVTGHGETREVADAVVDRWLALG